MRAIMVFCLFLLGALPALAAGPSWTAQWRDGGAHMKLLLQGNPITGSCPAYGGAIIGAVEGRELHGHWREGARSRAATVVLAPDGQSFRVSSRPRT